MTEAALPSMSRRIRTKAVNAFRILGTTKQRPPMVPLLIIIGVAVLAIFPSFIAPDSPTQTSLRDRMTPPFWLAGGSTNHLFGTDQVGRDIFSRIVYGARVSLSVAFFAVCVAGSIGLAVGLLAGYLGGWVDAALMRLVDAVIAIPLLLIALLLAAVLGPSERNLILVISGFVWVGYARVLRAEVLSVRERDYVAAAVAIGATTPRILLRHIFPNIAATFIVLITLQIGSLILAEASLSFLGAGVPPPKPAWGSMVADGRDVTLTAWWLSLFPGLAILLVVLSFNLLGDWLRDVLDPRVRRR